MMLKKKNRLNWSKTKSMWWAQSINKGTKSTTESNHIRWHLSAEMHMQLFSVPQVCFQSFSWSLSFSHLFLHQSSFIIQTTHMNVAYVLGAMAKQAWWKPAMQENIYWVWFTSDLWRLHASKGPSRLSRMVGPMPISSNVLDDDVQQPLPMRPVRTILLFSISSFTSVNSLWQGLWWFHYSWYAVPGCPLPPP